MKTKKQFLGMISHSIQMNSKGCQRIIDNRDLSIIQTRLINAIENRSYKKNAIQLNVLQNRGITVQMMPTVIQTRTVTNSMKRNMQASLARVFGGPASRYQINQNSGRTFSDGPPNYTIGHHGVTVTDTMDGGVYSCDFHNNGRYYTRG